MVTLLVVYILENVVVNWLPLMHILCIIRIETTEALFSNVGLCVRGRWNFKINSFQLKIAYADVSPIAEKLNCREAIAAVMITFCMCANESWESYLMS